MSAPAVKLVESVKHVGLTLKVNERVHLIDVGPDDWSVVVLLAKVLDRVGLVLEADNAAVAHRHVRLYAARRTRRATTVKL